MVIQTLHNQSPFTTKDTSTIRSILDRTNAPVANQSLAEASLPAGAITERHYHRLSEEIYFVLEGSGEMTVDDETCAIHPGDAVLIPPGAWHTLQAMCDIRFLCCCAPPTHMTTPTSLEEGDAPNRSIGAALGGYSCQPLKSKCHHSEG